MTEPLMLANATYLLGAAALSGAAAFLGAIGLAPPLGKLVARQEEAFHRALAELFLFDVTPRQLTYLVAAASGLAGLFGLLVALQAGSGLGGALIAAVVGMAAGFWIPRLVIYVLQQRRRARLNEQLIDGLVTLSNGMRAGLNLVQSMRLIEKNTQPPISQEFGLMLREFEHGTSIDEVLRRASARLSIHHYKLLFAAMETARVRGGNLPETLSRLGESLREIYRLEEKVKALTAQNRMSARMMGLMPFVIAGIYYMIDPTFVDVLFNDPWGLFLLLVAGVLTLTGFLWIRKIVTFEI